MKSFEYGDREVGTYEVFASVANMVIGFGVLTLPRSIVETTRSVDGWISILIGGLGALVFTWMVAKLVSRFPKRNLHDIANAVIGKPLAFLFTLMFAAYMLTFVAYETRGWPAFPGFTCLTGHPSKSFAWSSCWYSFMA